MNDNSVGSARKAQKQLQDSDDEEERVDMDKLFPKPIHKQREAVMYGRALNKLKTILNSKGLKDSSQVITQNNFGLVHFHIEDNNIQLSKFETRSPLGGVMFSEKNIKSWDMRGAQKTKYAPGLSTLKSATEVTSHNSTHQGNMKLPVLFQDQTV